MSLPQPKPWMDAVSGLVWHYNVFGELFAPCKSHEELAAVLEQQNDGCGRKAKVTFTAQELTSYLLSPSHPSPPTLFIQRTPADSARRYPTTTSSTCRLSSCPAHGKMHVGSYRVAIDERWATHNSTSDPFVVAGYVHLYCLERFVDLALLVKKSVNVVVDERVLKSEPKGRFAPSLAGAAEAGAAKAFLKALKEEDLIVLDQLFRNGGYAVHSPLRPDAGGHHAPKPHANTLTHLLHKLKLDKMPASRIRQQASRGMNAGNVLVHMGDLEVSEQAREEGGGVGGGGKFRLQEGWRSEGHVEKIRAGLKRSLKRRAVEEGEEEGEGEKEEGSEGKGEDEEEVDGDGDGEWRPARAMKRVRRSLSVRCLSGMLVL